MSSAEGQVEQPPEESATGNSASEKRFPCKQCGAQLKFAPGTTSLTCEYCGAENEIAAAPTVVEEQDFEAQIRAMEGAEETVDRLLLRCDGCAAEVQFPENVTSHPCPFCGKEVVATGRSVKLIKPRAVLPFAIKDEQARERFRAWLGSLWFAPSNLRQFAETQGGIAGVYLPFWTYDCDTDTPYAGQRGDDYYVTQPVTTMVNGKPQVRMQQVRKTRWTRVSGRVSNRFDDVLVCATKSLPPERVATLEPWDLKQLAPYADEYLAGFRSESYAMNLSDGFVAAKGLMQPVIRSTICRDIGGDHQRIERMSPSYHRITFKHILLPVWTLAYRYRGKLYSILINARTGEVNGQRPYSAWKIASLVAAILAVVLVIVLIAANSK